MALGPTNSHFLPPRLIAEEDFFQRFQGANSIATDEGSTEDSIISFEVGDCVTLFIRERVNGLIVRIFGHHFDSLSDQEEIREMISDFLQNEAGSSYRFCLIGGNGSEQSNECVQRIRNVANAFLQEGFRIKSLNEYLNLNQGHPFGYIHVNLRLKSRLVYCRSNGG